MVWLPDEDLRITTERINSLFSIFREYDLIMAQPAVDNFYIIHQYTHRKFGCKLRMVNFIELMCPIFKTEALFSILDTFTATISGMGIDWVWTKRFHNQKIAIIDACAVRHMKKISLEGPYYRKSRELGASPAGDREFVKAHYDLSVFEEYIEYEQVLYGWAKLLKSLGLLRLAQNLARKIEKLSDLILHFQNR